MNIAITPVRSNQNCDVAIIGAGPYGLAIAAHLRAANVPIRIFGEAVSFWRGNMPAGMKLRSPWIATHIADPQGALYARRLLPRSRHADPQAAAGGKFHRFTAAGFSSKWRRNSTPARSCVSSKVDSGFHLVLEDGERFFAQRVVMATGLLNHEFRPAQFNGLPRSLVSHSCEHTDSERYRGKRVAVIGRGQSACESAAILHEAGADVEIICRGNLEWNADPDERGSLRKAVRAMLGNMLIPPSQVGPFPFNWVNEAPGVMLHYLSRSSATAGTSITCARPRSCGCVRALRTCRSTKGAAFSRRAATATGSRSPSTTAPGISTT